MLNLQAKFKCAGRYKIQVRKAESGVICHETPWFDNLITDNGLDMMWAPPGGAFGIRYMVPACYVGSGNTPPAVTDSTLVALVAGVGSSSGEWAQGSSVFVEEAGGIPAYWRQTWKYRFGTGVAAGNLSEVAVGWTSTNLFSRALIVDGAGNPTTITVLADEVLDVTYELRVYIDKTATPIAFSISGVPYTGVVRQVNIDAPPQLARSILEGSNQLIARTGFPATVYDGVTGGSMSPTSTTYPGGYVSGSRQVNIQSFYDTGAGGGTFGGFVFENANFHRLGFSVSPGLSKTTFQKLTMNTRLSWDRYTP